MENRPRLYDFLPASEHTTSTAPTLCSACTNTSQPLSQISPSPNTSVSKGKWIRLNTGLFLQGQKDINIVFQTLNLIHLPLLNFIHLPLLNPSHLPWPTSHTLNHRPTSRLALWKRYSRDASPPRRSSSKNWGDFQRAECL